MDKFTQKLNKVSPRKIVVTEYQTEKSNPEESFKKMVESGAKCDGLVISGHHTGSFGGKRSEKSLGIDFMEKISCDPKYSKWFEKIEALWLQGCRTLGVKIEIDDQTSADFHTERVGAVLQEDNLTQSFAALNLEFSATLDQDNPLSSRYLRLFPQATVFGWTKTAPGEKSRSELSIPYHIAHIANLNRDRNFFFTAPDKELDPKSAAKYASTLLSLLNKKEFQNTNCYLDEKRAVDGWLAHGGAKGRLPFSFDNPDLQAFESFAAQGNPLLEDARRIDCLLKNVTDKNLRLEILDTALKDERLLGYTFNSIWQLIQDLKSEGKFEELKEVQEKLKSSSVLKHFLMRKLATKELGIIRKVDYYAFYRDMSGESYPNIEAHLQEGLVKVFSKPAKSYDESDFQQTILDSMVRSGLVTEDVKNRAGKTVVNFLNDSNSDVRKSAVIALGKLKPTDPAVHLALSKALSDSELNVRVSAVLALKEIKPADPVIHLALVKALSDSDSDVRERVTWALREIKPTDPAVHLALVKALSDTNRSVRSDAESIIREIKLTDPAVHLALVKILSDFDSDVRVFVAYALREIKPTDSVVHLAFVKALSDPDHLVRYNVSSALREIKPTDSVVHLALAKALTDPNRAVSSQAAFIIREIKPTDPVVHLALVKALSDSNSNVRENATSALAEIKPTDQAVLKEIKKVDIYLYNEISERLKK